MLAIGILYIFGAWKTAIPLHALNRWWLVFGLALNWIGDTGAFYVGRRFGMHKLAPRVTKAVIGDDDVVRLEQVIDGLETELPPLRRFILAGGTSAGAALHVARTVCRRAERRMVALTPAVDPVLIRYVNRLSDLLFVLARVVNHRGGVAETEW